MPSVGQSAYLVRCEDLDSLTYALVTARHPDVGGLGLCGKARSDAAHPATDVFAR